MHKGRGETTQPMHSQSAHLKKNKIKQIINVIIKKMDMPISTAVNVIH